MYALIRTGGKQYLVSPGDQIEVEYLPGKAGDAVLFSDVLAVRTGDQLLTGMAAASASVSGTIVAQTRGPKLKVLKYRKTKQYKIMRGHRQHLTSIQVSEITV